jgi:nitroreductase
MLTHDAIRIRKTEKVLSATSLPCRTMRDVIDELIELAGQAPFHRACEESHRSGDLNGIEPWRFYCLDAATCRELVSTLPQENAGKIPAMLNSADALVMATWLPNADDATPIGDERGFAATHTNMEHIAAASAAIQNLLLAATARGISNYWSSGGVLRSPSVFGQLGISTQEILLGAVFLFPKETQSSERVLSKLRDSRSPKNAWSRWVSTSNR